MQKLLHSTQHSQCTTKSYQVAIWNFCKHHIGKLHLFLRAYLMPRRKTLLLQLSRIKQLSKVCREHCIPLKHICRILWNQRPKAFGTKESCCFYSQMSPLPSLSSFVMKRSLSMVSQFVLKKIDWDKEQRRLGSQIGWFFKRFHVVSGDSYKGFILYFQNPLGFQERRKITTKSKDKGLSLSQFS